MGKSQFRVLGAFALVLAVGAALWFTAPVSALNVSFPALPSPNPPGSTLSFSVKIDIRDFERVPIQRIDLEIYNASDPSQKATITGLPLVENGTSSMTSSGGTISITDTALTDWHYTYGEGYAIWEDTGEPFNFGPGWGYGGAPASIQYTGSWISPSNWPAGLYKIKLSIIAGSTTFNKISSDFTLTAPPAPPSGGGGGGGFGGPKVAPPGTTFVSDFVGTSGVFIKDITAKSADGKVWLTILKGTKGKDRFSEPLSEIKILEMKPIPDPPAGARIIGLVYDIDPDLTTWEPPITITFTYTQEDVAEGVSEEELVIAMWDEATSTWIILEGIVVDPATNTISALLSHTSAYTVLAYPPATAAFTLAGLSISPTKAEVGETVSISVGVTNHGSLSGNHTVTLKVNNLVVETKQLTLASGAGEVVTFTTTRDVAGSYSVDINGLTGTFTVQTSVVPPVTPAADFNTSVLTITPAKVKAGEPITISALVANPGDAAGTYNVNLKIDSEVVETKEITLAAGASQIVSFTTSQDIPGKHTVDIDGNVGTLTVKSPINWWIIGLIIVAGITIGIISSGVVRRRLAG